MRKFEYLDRAVTVLSSDSGDEIIPMKL